MDINPKLMVLGGIGFGMVYIFLNQDLLSTAWSPWFPIAALLISGYFFNDNFVEKSLVKKEPLQNYGPSEPFAPQQIQPQFDLGDDGRPIPITPSPRQFRRQ